MKWFKHYSNARGDESLARLEDAAGLEGYGFYFKMLEIVAEKMDGTDKCHLEYSLKKWSTLLGIHHHKFNKLLSVCEVNLLLLTSYPTPYPQVTGGSNKEVTIRVTIPNLLKYRDNYTKDLQVTSKQEVEVEVDVSPAARVSPAAQHIIAVNDINNLSDLRTKKPLKTKIIESATVQEIFDHWKAVLNHPRSVLGDKTSKLIKARLKEGFSQQDLIDAVTGCSRSDFHMGDNADKKIYDSLDLILRNSEKTNGFIKVFSEGKKLKHKIDGLSKAGNNTANNLQDWLDDEAKPIDLSKDDEPF